MTPSRDSSYCEITLTQGQVAKVDAFLYDWLNQHKWQAKWHQETRSFYAARSLSRKLNGGKQVTVFMHREILGLPPKGQDRIGEHEDHDTLNNRGGNLRPASHSSNQHNRYKSKNNTSGFKGVCYSKREGKWQSNTTLNGKHVWLGYSDTAEGAARKYDAFALAHHGAFAQLNFPHTE